MIVFVSPAKGFDEVDIDAKSIPNFIDNTVEIIGELKKLSIEKIEKVMKVKNDIASLNFERFSKFRFDINGAPAILSYKGLQYQNMFVHSFTIEDLEYSNDHIRILSGLYGVVKPLDAIYPYRLEMMTKVSIAGKKNLYDYWGNKIYENLKADSDGIIVNLASDEYSKSVKPYVEDSITYVTCTFKTEKNGKLKTLATASKTARGNMVNYIVKNRIDNYEKLKEFDIDGYKYSEELSSKFENTVNFVFTKI